MTFETISIEDRQYRLLQSPQSYIELTYSTTQIGQDYILFVKNNLRSETLSELVAIWDLSAFTQKKCLRHNATVD